MNWRMAEVFMGPRQSTAWSGSLSRDSMDTTNRFSPAALGWICFLSLASRLPEMPSMRGTLGPCRSTSRMPTRRPLAARAAARFTAMELLPTPPLPLMTKIL